MGLNDVLNAITIAVFFAFLNGVLEQSLVPLKGELIHRINLVEVVEDEEKDGGDSFAHSVSFSGLINSFHCLLCSLKVILNLFGSLFGCLKCLV